MNGLEIIALLIGIGALPVAGVLGWWVGKIQTEMLELGPPPIPAEFWEGWREALDRKMRVQRVREKFCRRRRQP